MSHRAVKPTLQLRRVVFTFITAVSIALGTTALSAQSPATTTLDVGIIGVSSSIWPAIVAKEKGFFAAQGLDVNTVAIGASARVLQQVVSGAVEIGSSSLVDTFRAIDGGGGVKIFQVSQAVGPYRLIGGKTIHSIAELKGKRIMTGGEKDLTNLWWETIARHNGLDPVKDVDLLFSGASSARLAALLSGGIDASVLSPPQTYMAIAQGGTDLGSAAPYLGDFPTMAWHVNDKWGKANPNIVIAFAKANDEAVRYMSDPAHRTEVAQILAKASGLTVDDASKTWDQSIAEKAFSPDGAASPQAIQHVADILAAAGDLKTPVKPPAAFYDDSYLRAAAQ